MVIARVYMDRNVLEKGLSTRASVKSDTEERTAAVSNQCMI